MLCCTVSSDHRPDLVQLRGLSESLAQSLYVTPPKPVAVPDPDLTLQALCRAYVAPVGAPRSLTKGVVTDKVVHALRKQGLNVRRSEYVGDFIFDAVVDRPGGPVVCNVLSFATTKNNAIPIERDAGHFLYGVEQLRVPGIAIIEPPANSVADEVRSSHDRVRRWFAGADVDVQSPTDVSIPELANTRS
jgi:hypothetical protein